MGVGAEALWKGLVEGRSALGKITAFDASGFPCALGGEVREFAVKDYVPKSYRKATKVMARDTELAVAAAKLAVQDAGLTTRGTVEEGAEAALTYPAARLGCNIGAGLIAAETEEMSQAMVTALAGGKFDLGRWGGGEGESGGASGMDALTPLWLLKYLPNMLACHVTIIHGAEGPSNTITCSEASGLLSIGESMRIIERGAADICFSGSAESKVNPMGLLRMDFGKRMARVDASETDGSRVVRPYDAKGAGGVIGEGGGIVMLENRDTALQRGARMYAEAVGFGGGQSDAWYSAGADDEGMRSAIENALEDAQVTAEQISCIVPQASGVGYMDRAEAGALWAVFGARLAEVPLVTIQPNIGNCVAGASGLQMVVGALCLKHQTLPARIHHGTPMPGMQAGAAPSRGAKLEYALLTSGSLGGQNAAVVLRSC